MRKWIVGGLLIMLMAGYAASALSPAAPVDAHVQFEKYASFKHDTSGAWSVHDLGAAQLLRTIAAGSARNFMSSGACILYPSVRGDSELGLTEIVLNVCLLRSQPINADSLSIVVGGVRYDFLAPSRKERIGSYACERFELPMDDIGMRMLDAMATNGFSITVYGDSRFYRTTVDPSAETLTAKQTFEAQSLGLIGGLLVEMTMDEYGLWDLNEAHWSAGRAQMAVVELNNNAYADTLPKLDDVFQQLASNEQAAVRSMQQLLRDTSFYAGNIDGRYGAATRTAIREAQKYYRQLETGQADRGLIDLLAGNGARDIPRSEPQTPEIIAPNLPKEAKAGVLYRCEGVAEISIDRYWFASKLMPMHATTQAPTTTPGPSPTPSPTQAPAAQAIAPTNAANRLLTFDGEMTNLHTEALFLPLAVQAEILTSDGYTYPLTIRTEMGAGTAFGTELLPLESARIILYTEVPPEIVLADIAQLTIKIASTDKAMEILIGT